MKPQYNMFEMENSESPMVMKSQGGADVSVDFNYKTITIDGKYEFDWSDDVLKSLCIQFKSVPYTLLQIVQIAQSLYSDVRAELLSAERDQGAHVEYLKSPRLTGRI